MDDVVQILKDVGAILEGHFIGVSGRHLSLYVNKDAWLPHTGLVSKICQMLAEQNKDKNIDVVVGPAVGGIPLSQWTAYHLSQMTGRDVLSVFTEKTPDDNQIFKRGYDTLVKGKRILAVEDTLTTGGSVKKTIDTVLAAGGDLVQLSVIINRDPVNVTEATFGVPFQALAELPSESFAEGEVPDWLANIPINTTVGHGAKYLKEHGGA
jgi:orotate phosphoribosyltransferase